MDMERGYIYDRVCSVLTKYDKPDEFDLTLGEIVDEMYMVLSLVENGWEYIITRQEEN